MSVFDGTAPNLQGALQTFKDDYHLWQMYEQQCLAGTASRHHPLQTKALHWRWDAPWRLKNRQPSCFKPFIYRKK